MPAIDYYGIEKAISAVLTADADFIAANGKAFIEEDFIYGLSDWGRAALIYMDRRSPTPGQPIAAGQQTRYHIRLSVWSRAFHVESMKKAIEERDALLGTVETALMRKRTLNTQGTDVVTFLTLEGGEMMSAKSSKPPGFIASAETVVVVEKKTTTT